MFIVYIEMDFPKLTPFYFYEFSYKESLNEEEGERESERN